MNAMQFGLHLTRSVSVRLSRAKGVDRQAASTRSGADVESRSQVVIYVFTSPCTARVGHPLDTCREYRRAPIHACGPCATGHRRKG